MNEVINGIINEYKSGAKSLEETNKALKAAGAGFHLSADSRDGWTEAEMKEGFYDMGKPAKDVQRKPDMSRRTDLAGQTVTQHTAAGDYSVTYNEDGYAVKAIKD